MILVMFACSLIQVWGLASVEASHAARGEQVGRGTVDSTTASTTASQMVCVVCYLNFVVVCFTISYDLWVLF